jgi:hypothetical protein
MNNENGVVLDPFAGSSSTAIEALHLGHNSICIDINPLTNFLTETKTQRITFNLAQQTPMKLDRFLGDNEDKSIKAKNKTIHLKKFIGEVRKNDEYFCPKWKNIDHWYPEEFKEIITNLWGYIYSVEDDFPKDFMNLVKLTALYVSRYLSYGARDVPKLFRSKRRIEQIEKLREKVKDNPLVPMKVFSYKIVKYYDQMRQLANVLEKSNITPKYERELTLGNYCSKKMDTKKIICLGNTDIISFDFPREEEFIDLIVTSPPYIYAQEYIRSTKMDLYWMNLVDDLRVREVTRKELGNKRNTDIDLIKEKLTNIDSFNAITKVLEKKEREKLGKNGKYTSLTYNYFYDMHLIIEKISRYLKKNGIFGLFVGNPTVLGHQVPCNKIFCEFFLDLGLNIIEYGYDEIVSPRLLKGRQNLSPDGMKAEWLIIGQK